MSKPVLTKEFIKSRYEYRDGVLYHRAKAGECQYSKQFNTRYAGTVVGGVANTGYIQTSLMINGKQFDYLAHRLIYTYFHGVQPKVIDHIDGDKLNNRLENLKSGTHQENMRNIKLSKLNTSGFTGVSWSKRDSKWYVRIKANNHYLFLGSFSNKDHAIAARKKGNIEYGYHENHGRIS